MKYQGLLIGITLALLLAPGPLFAQETMKMVYFDSFPPYSWLAEDESMKGILVEVVGRVLQEEMGIPLSHQGYPWARAQHMVQYGDADAFVTVPTDARRAYTEISREAVVTWPITIFTNTNNKKTEAMKKVRRIDDLAPFSILDYHGNGWGEANLKSFDRYLTSNLNNVFLMLANERADLCATDSIVAAYVIKELGLQDKIVEIPVVLDEVSFCLCIGKQSPFVHLLPEFDKTIRRLREEGKLEPIYQKYR